MRVILHLFLSILLVFSVGFAHAENSLKDIEQELSDSLITTKIKAKYTKNKALNPLKISVTTKNGVVHLKGHVKNNEAYVEALRLAKKTKGVHAVGTDELLIQQVNYAVTDAYITAKVEAAVLQAKVFDDESIPLVGINASTSNGIVTLSGKLQQKQSITAILKRVNTVSGIKKIISKLQISKDS